MRPGQMYCGFQHCWESARYPLGKGWWGKVTLSQGTSCSVLPPPAVPRSQCLYLAVFCDLLTLKALWRSLFLLGAGGSPAGKQPGSQASLGLGTLLPSWSSVHPPAPWEFPNHSPVFTPNAALSPQTGPLPHCVSGPWCAHSSCVSVSQSSHPGNWSLKSLMAGPGGGSWAVVALLTWMGTSLARQ